MEAFKEKKVTGIINFLVVQCNLIFNKIADGESIETYREYERCLKILKVLTLIDKNNKMTSFGKTIHLYATLSYDDIKNAVDKLNNIDNE